MTDRDEALMTRALLMELAAEDWYRLSEAVGRLSSSVVTKGPEALPLAKTGLRSLLEEGLIEIGRVDFASNGEAILGLREALAALEDDTNWLSTNASTAVAFAATRKGLERVRRLESR
jgi:hypothetical protein